MYNVVTVDECYRTNHTLHNGPAWMRKENHINNGNTAKCLKAIMSFSCQSWLSRGSYRVYVAVMGSACPLQGLHLLFLAQIFAWLTRDGFVHMKMWPWNYRNFNTVYTLHYDIHVLILFLSSFILELGLFYLSAIKRQHDARRYKASKGQTTLSPTWGTRQWG